jgi:hypothetical protein
VEFRQLESLTKRVNSFDERMLFEYVCDDLLDIPEPYRSNYHSFLINLWSYSLEVKPEFRHMDLGTIHRRSITEGSSFAQWMDRYKSYILGVYSDREYFSDEIYSQFHPLPLNTKEGYVNLSGIYRSNSLFEWIPEKANLKEICFSPVNISCEDLEEFRKITREYLDEEKFRFLKMPDWREFVGPSDKKTADGPYWSADDATPAMTRGRSVLVHINRELKGARAAVKEEYSSVLRIRWIEKSVQKILAMDSRDVSRNQAFVLKAKLRQACSKGGYSYCRDFNKEGLTKPWPVIKVLMEELYDASGWQSFEPTSFFDNWTYEEDGVIHYPTRGHGLGMANALTTFMNIILEEMCSRRVGYAPNFSGYNNDDAATYFCDRRHAINYATMDREICEGLGLDFKPKASYIAKEEISLCEQYWSLKNRDYGYKGSYSTEAFFGLLKCTNASEAKFRASSTDVTYIPKNYMTIVINYWGWTLYRNEQSRVKTFGGWFPLKIKNVDLTFSKVKGTDVVPREEYSAWKAMDLVELQIRPWDKRTVANRMYDHYPEEFLETYEISKEYVIGANARTSIDPAETKRMWTMYQTRLRQEFKKQNKLYDKLKQKPTYSEVYLAEIEKNFRIDYVPPIDRRYGEHCTETSVKDWSFRSPYSNLGLELELELWKNDPHKCNNICEGSINLSLNKFGEGYRGAVARAKELGLAGWETYSLPGPQARDNFIDPYAYIRVCDISGSQYRSWIPTDLNPKKLAYLEERDKLFGEKRLRLDEWPKIGAMNSAEIFMVRKIYKMREHLTEDQLEDLISLGKKFPGIGHSAQGCYKLSQILKRVTKMAKILAKTYEWDFPKVFSESMEQTYPYSYFSGQKDYPDVCDYGSDISVVSDFYPGFEEMPDPEAEFRDDELSLNDMSLVETSDEEYQEELVSEPALSEDELAMSDHSEACEDDEITLASDETFISGMYDEVEYIDGDTYEDQIGESEAPTAESMKALSALMDELDCDSSHRSSESGPSRVSEQDEILEEEFFQDDEVEAESEGSPLSEYDDESRTLASGETFMLELYENVYLDDEEVVEEPLHDDENHHVDFTAMSELMNELEDDASRGSCDRRSVTTSVSNLVDSMGRSIIIDSSEGSPIDESECGSIETSEDPGSDADPEFEFFTDENPRGDY